jgi:hypothetical protein
MIAYCGMCLITQTFTEALGTVSEQLLIGAPQMVERGEGTAHALEGWQLWHAQIRRILNGVQLPQRRAQLARRAVLPEIVRVTVRDGLPQGDQVPLGLNGLIDIQHPNGRDSTCRQPSGHRDLPRDLALIRPHGRDSDDSSWRVEPVHAVRSAAHKNG